MQTANGLFSPAGWLLLLLSACASIEPGRYGVDRVAIEGTKAMSERVLETCLLTHERSSFELPLGVTRPRCDRPPFDRAGARLSLWRWPWTDWPTFNHAVLERDVERVMRWYRARGFYDARVVRVDVDPPQAESSPTCDSERDDCRVSVTLVVEEGQPVSVAEVHVDGASALDEALRRRLHAALSLLPGARFDETAHDATKQALVELLRRSGFAAARVDGVVSIDSQRRRAVIRYQVASGPTFRFGRVTLEGHGGLPVTPLVRASGVEAGARYDPASVKEAQIEVQAIGGFASVAAQEVIDETTREVHLTLHVTRPDKHELRLGVGVTSGTLQRGDDASSESVPQWDAHLLARYAHNHVFETLAGFRIEDRPRLIFNAAFPRAEHPAFGNVLDLSVQHAGLLDARTRWLLGATWDYGPDPFLGFQRSDIVARLTAERAFFSRRLRLQLGVQQDFYRVPQRNNTTHDGSRPPSSYDISFLVQRLVVDGRDRPVRSRSGAYFGLTLREAPRWAASDWTLFSLRPELRAYLPLVFDVVLAGRVALARTFIADASGELDETSQRLGPSVYRLRGGGATSVRGFLPGQLGAGIEGGTHRWELMLELRVPLGQVVELAGLLDAGDVSVEQFRWSHWNTSAGFGLRVHTPLGALRLDTGVRVDRLQRADGARPAPLPSGWFGIPGAVHFTLGEAF